jgi:predicted SAM-dependent methyltransferase
MIKDSTVSLIYASHCFEYFDQLKASEVLAEWKRCLNESGIIRLAVPDFDKLLSIYQETNDLNKILGPLFGRWQLNDKKVLYHKVVYNKVLLSKLLSDAGFVNITEWDWEEDLPHDYDDYSRAYYPHMDFENGICISLNIQAQKQDNK